MAQQEIDLTAGMVPRTSPPASSDGIDLSAGVMPRQATNRPAAPAQNGFLDSLLDSSGGRVLGNAVMHPGHALSVAGDAARRVFAPNQPEHMADNPNPIISGIGREINRSKAQLKDAWNTPSSHPIQAIDHTMYAIPFVGSALQRMDQQVTDKNYSGAAGTGAGTVLSALVPEAAGAAAKALPKALRRGGEMLQDAGASRMTDFINGGKKAESPAAGAEVLASGPSVSVSATRPSLTNNIRAARQQAGPAISAAVNGSQARIPLREMRNAVDSTLIPMKQTATGPLGNPNVANRLDQVRDSFGPTLDMTGTVTPAALHDSIQTMDKNINWNRGPDPVDATARNAGRQIRGKASTILKSYVPEAVQPIERYRNLSDALEMAEDNEGVVASRPAKLMRFIADAGAFGAGTAMHSPETGIAAAAATHLAPWVWHQPAIQTGLATGMYQGGKLAEMLGSKLPYPPVRLPRLVGPLSVTASPQLNLSAPVEVPSDNGQRNNNGSSTPNNQLEHALPPAGGTSSIRPSLKPLVVSPIPYAPTPTFYAADRPMKRLGVPATVRGIYDPIRPRLRALESAGGEEFS